MFVAGGFCGALLGLLLADSCAATAGPARPAPETTPDPPGTEICSDFDVCISSVWAVRIRSSRCPYQLDLVVLITIHRSRAP